MKDSDDTHRSLGQLLDDIEALSRRDGATVSDVMQAYGTQAGFPVLLMASSIVASPLSGIPFVSSLCGITIVLISLQLVLRRSALWLPGRLRRIPLSAERLSMMARRMGPVAAWLDGRARMRWRVLHRDPARSVLLVLCLVAGGMMPLLEFVPFSSSILGGFVLLIAFGLMVRDGLFIALALVPVAAFVGLLATLR